VSAFAERIACFLRDEDLRRRAGEAGYSRLVRYFTIERNVTEFLGEYARALVSSGGGPRR
jgi:glycosyltransferase involved in cell wall biosynthesis